MVKSKKHFKTRGPPCAITRTELQLYHVHFLMFHNMLHMLSGGDHLHDPLQSGLTDPVSYVRPISKLERPLSAKKRAKRAAAGQSFGCFPWWADQPLEPHGLPAHVLPAWWLGQLLAGGLGILVVRLKGLQHQACLGWLTCVTKVEFWEFIEVDISWNTVFITLIHFFLRNQCDCDSSHCSCHDFTGILGEDFGCHFLPQAGL